MTHELPNREAKIIWNAVPSSRIGVEFNGRHSGTAADLTTENQITKRQSPETIHELLRQIEANRRNARLSTGPITEEGKRRSRQNAVRHSLTAESVIDALEDAEDYAAFEMAITADYDAQSAVERELDWQVCYGA